MQLMEEQSVNGSDEDDEEGDDDFHEPDSDEDLSDNNDERNRDEVTKSLVIGRMLMPFIMFLV